MDACQPFNGSYAATLDQQMSDLHGLVEWHAQIVQRLLRNVRKRPAALFASVALMPVLKPDFTALHMAIMTRHLILSGLCPKMTVNPQDSVSRLRPLDAKPSVTSWRLLCF
jgi:hypothetical protein